MTSPSDPFASDPFAARSPSYPGGIPAPPSFTPSAGDASPSAPGGGRGLTVATPPIGLLAVAGAVAVLGVVLGLVAGGSGPLALAGWALAGPGAIGVLSAFTLLDTKRRAAPVYMQPTWITAVYWSVLVVAGVGIVIGALRVADWVGRL